MKDEFILVLMGIVGVFGLITLFFVCMGPSNPDDNH